jgi:hypothetical protein
LGAFFFDGFASTPLPEALVLTACRFLRWASQKGTRCEMAGKRKEAKSRLIGRDGRIIPVEEASWRRASAVVEPMPVSRKSKKKK